MGRYIGIDYGSKRCGIAVSDNTRMFASGLDTVPSHELMNYLEKYFSTEEVDRVIIGKPMTLQNKPSESFVLAERFVSAFKKRFPSMEIVWQDERYTSRLAMQAMVDGGMKQKERRKKENLDKISAAILLQSYLDSES